MITLDKYSMLQLPEGQEFIDEKTKIHCLEVWHNQKFRDLDTITGTEKEMGDLVAMLEKMVQASPDLLEHPALREFEVAVAEPIPSLQRTIVRFKESALPHLEQKYEYGDGNSVVRLPVVDAYISFWNPDEVDCILTIYSVHYLADGREFATGSGQDVHWKSPEFSMKLMLQDANEFNEMMRDIKLLYLAIQKAMIDKPTVFYESKGNHGTNENGKKKKRKHMTRVVRKIRINAREVKQYLHTHRITCKCWGVMGHWRNYKSGKKVWIEPYRKGSERNNPSAYEAKEYLMGV